MYDYIPIKGTDSWPLEKRLQFSRDQEARCSENRDDPDEDTIYNVLCPQIRARWSKKTLANRKRIKDERSRIG